MGGAFPSSCIHHRQCRHLRVRRAINPDAGLGLGAEGEVLCLNLCPALGETLLMVRVVIQMLPSHGTLIFGFCRLSCPLLPQPGAPARGFSAPKPSLAGELGVLLGGGTGGGTFAVILGTLLPPLLHGAALVQPIYPSSDSGRNGELGPEGFPVQNFLSPV